MSILLPTRPGVRVATPRLVDFGAVLTPPMGGVAQRLNRIGNRFAVDVEAPTSDSTGIGPRLVARLVAGLTKGVLMPFPQDVDTGAPGAPVIDGAAQLGSTLSVRGFAANYPIVEGQFFSIIFGGRRYVHMAAGGDVAADASGKAAITIEPMLRISPNDGASVEFGQPMIEGFMSGNVEWQLQTAPYLDVKFTVTEAA